MQVSWRGGGGRARVQLARTLSEVVLCAFLGNCKQKKREKKIEDNMNEKNLGGGCVVD